jgi:hypothetical protein
LSGTFYGSGPRGYADDETLDETLDENVTTTDENRLALA